jgi:hypothetical protein
MMTDVTIRIYLGNPYRQLDVNEAIIYLATGLMPHRVWTNHAIDSMILEFNAASREKRRGMLKRSDPVIVSAGRLEEFGVWLPFRGTEIDISPLGNDEQGRAMLSIKGARTSNTENAVWLLQTLGSAQQIALAAEAIAPVLEEQENEKKES